MDTPSVNLSDLDAAGLESFVQELGLPKFRAAQIRQWISKGASFDEMTNLPKDVRELLKSESVTGGISIRGKVESSIDETAKYLFDLGDGNLIESVLMKYKYGYSACVSTQAGCRMGCTFCASRKLGLSRNLTASEILGQVKSINRDKGISIGHIVMMGVGEPLDNYDNVLEFMRRAHSDDGLNISYRKMSLSTCGIIPGIEKLMNEDLPITLSISLHSPFQAQRAEMMPIANKYSLDKLLEICNIYSLRTGRRITYEYSLIDGVNDTPDHSSELIKLLKGKLCHINLIPVNPVEGTGYRRGEKQKIDAFRQTLEDGGLEATVRRAMGRDIEAACGQLRRQALEGRTEGT